MKTLKFITLTFLFAAFVTVAMANSTVKNTLIRSTDDLRQVIKEKVESNYAEPFNLLYKKGVDKLEENVEIIFSITPENTISIMSVNSKNSIASDFVMQLLQKEKLEIDRLLAGQIYRINIKLSYRAS